MASLKEVIRENRNEIVEGMAWVVIWKNGRSWNCECFWEESGSYEDGYEFRSEDVKQMNEISKIDSKAIAMNGYYMAFGEDFTLEELENKILLLYESRLNQLRGDFLGCLVKEIDTAKKVIS